MADGSNRGKLALLLALWGWVALSLVAWGAQFRDLIAALAGLG